MGDLPPANPLGFIALGYWPTLWKILVHTCCGRNWDRERSCHPLCALGLGQWELWLLSLGLPSWKTSALLCVYIYEVVKWEPEKSLLRFDIAQHISPGQHNVLLNI